MSLGKIHAKEATTSWHEFCLHLGLRSLYMVRLFVVGIAFAKAMQGIVLHVRGRFLVLK